MHCLVILYLAAYSHLTSASKAEMKDKASSLMIEKVAEKGLQQQPQMDSAEAEVVSLQCACGVKSTFEEMLRLEKQRNNQLEATILYLTLQLKSYESIADAIYKAEIKVSVTRP